MRALFPEIKPNTHYSLAVDPIHTLYVEECGNDSGIPVVFLHGGPGAGCEPWHRQFFDPERYRIILFDQRGCGRSTPHASLENNSTQHLINDLETLRNHLGIKQWLVFGGSWGSTLGLVYAQTHPGAILGLILRGIFLCRQQEIDWFYQQGASRIFPEHWQEFIAPIPGPERHDLVSAHYKRLTSDDEIARMASAKAWSIWEGKASTLRPKTSVVDFFGSAHTALSLARIESHYFKHNCFLDDNQILNNAHQLKNIPGLIVHGRYDIVCPVENAWELNRSWPGSTLQIVPDAGHSASEPGTVHALVSATDNFVEMLS